MPHTLLTTLTANVPSGAVTGSAFCSECKERPRAHYDLCFQCANGMPDFDDDGEDRVCPRCNGVGGDPMDDYCTPCDHCGGEGYEFWK